MSQFFRLVWRGALGGIIGPTIFVVYVVYRQPGQILGIAYLPIILVVTGVVGALIGLVIALLCLKAGFRTGVVLRLVVGVSLATCFWTIYRYLRGNEGIESSWVDLVSETVVFASIIGVFPALLAAPKRFGTTRSK